MKLLCIDTTKQQAVIALNNDGVLSYFEIPETKRHSEALLGELENFLCENKLTIQDITHLGCVTGPGSFTGIRIGMATIKAFSFALNMPIVSDDYFSIVASSVKNGYVALKNTSNAVYLTQIVDCVANKIEVVENEKILDTIKDNDLYVSEFEHFDCVESYKNLCTINNYNQIMLNHFTQKVENKQFTNSNEFSPVYAQLSQAERDLKD